MSTIEMNRELCRTWALDADGQTERMVLERLARGVPTRDALEKVAAEYEEGGSEEIASVLYGLATKLHTVTRGDERRAARMERNAATRAGRVLPIFVAMIGIDRAYGGREEGGWWYDVTQVLEVRKAWDWKQALKFARELNEEYPTCKRGRFSVIGGTDTKLLVLDSLDKLPEEGPFTKPRYE